MDINKLRLKDKKLCLIVNSENFKTINDFLDFIAKSLNDGINIIQLQENHSSSKRIIELANRIRELCSIYDALFIIQDRIDIAQIVEADGIFLDKNDIDIHSAQKLIENTMIIGVNISSKEEALHAQNHEVHYLTINEDFLKNNNDAKIWLEENIKIPYFFNKKYDKIDMAEILANTKERIYFN